LSVATALEDNSAINTETRPITGSKNSLAGTEPRWATRKHAFTKVWAVEVPRAHLRPADPELTNHTRGDWLAILTHNPNANSPERMPKVRRPIGKDGGTRRIDGAFCRPVNIECSNWRIR
jgi:hypothetical protein